MAGAFRTITVRTTAGDVAVQAAPTPVPGLYVVHSGDAGMTGLDYAVIHESGISAARFFPDPETALAAAVAFGELADWSVSAWELAQVFSEGSAALAGLAAAAARWGGDAAGPVMDEDRMRELSA